MKYAIYFLLAILSNSIYAEYFRLLPPGDDYRNSIFPTRIFDSASYFINKNPNSLIREIELSQNPDTRHALAMRIHFDGIANRQNAQELFEIFNRENIPLEEHVLDTNYNRSNTVLWLKSINIDDIDIYKKALDIVHSFEGISPEGLLEEIKVEVEKRASMNTFIGSGSQQGFSITTIDSGSRPSRGVSERFSITTFGGGLAFSHNTETSVVPVQWSLEDGEPTVFENTQSIFPSFLFEGRAPAPPFNLQQWFAQLENQVSETILESYTNSCAPRRNASISIHAKHYKILKQVSDAQCSICLSINEPNQTIIDMVQLNCPGNHIFCRDCIEESYKYKQICPNCRGPILEKD